MSSDTSADAAIQTINGTEVMGRNIKVNYAKPVSRKKSSSNRKSYGLIQGRRILIFNIQKLPDIAALNCPEVKDGLMQNPSSRIFNSSRWKSHPACAPSDKPVVISHGIYKNTFHICDEAVFQTGLSPP